MDDLRLIEDGKRWRALNVATGCGGAFCAACDLVGVETEVNIDGAAVVSWDVAGDSRSFVFVCDDCVSVAGGDLG